MYQAGRAHETAVLLSYILYELGAGSAPSSAELSPDQEIIGKINSYIHDHLNMPFTLRDVGKHCALSVSGMSLHFKKSMGMSLGHYIRAVRINHAMKLLIQTDLTVSEIAYQSGFTSPAIFCRAFKQKTGNSALTFRKSKQS
jgi:AraC-like DNA-binding protein